MKRRRDRQQKLHESLINMLYAPPSPSPPPNRSEFDEQTLDLAREIATSDHHHINTYEFEEEDGRSEEEEEAELGSQKLTRAQRKRLRKKKLKEVASSNRSHIIGPQLPSTGDDDQIDGEHQRSEGVRRNVTQGSESRNDHNFIREETPSAIKVKHRRMSKKIRQGTK